MDKFELQKLRDLPIEGVAERLGLRVVRHKSLCPFHEDHTPSLSFCTRRNTFRCFVCGASGGTIDLAMKHLNVGFMEACKWLADKNNVILSEWKAPAPTRAAEKSTFSPERYERFFERPWLNEAARQFLFGERKLDERVVRWCKLTSWQDKQGVNWLQIPYYDMEGKLIGIQNRNLGYKKDSPEEKGMERTVRFRFPLGSRCSIYNLPVLKLLRPLEDLYITEGASDCWSMLSSGHKAIAIPSATLLKPDDAKMIASITSQLSVKLHMYPDRDEPGERLFLQLQECLSAHCVSTDGNAGQHPTLMHHHLPPGCKDYSDYYVQRLSSTAQS